MINSLYSNNKWFYKIIIIVGFLFLFITCKKKEEPVPEITKIEPLEASIGSVIKITGKFLTTVQTVSFGGKTAVPIEKKPTEITCVIPDNASLGNIKISVSNDVGESNSLTLKVLAGVPQLSKITPSRAGSGMEVKISGKNLNVNPIVSFNDKTAQIVTASDTVLTVKVPSGLVLGATNIIVKTDGGTSKALSFTTVGTPTITGFTPLIGPVDKIVTITGTFLDENPILKFNQTTAVISAKTNTQITTKVPSGASSGKITITTDGGLAVTLTDFTVKDAPSITSFSPTTGFTTVTDVTITGLNLANATSVSLGGGTTSSFSKNTETELVFKVPTGASTGKINVTTPAGSGTSTNDFTITGSPVITSFTPTQGLIDATVTITGTNLAGATSVKFNGASAVISANSATQITTKVPATATTGKISVTTGGGTAFSPTDFTALIPPIISGFNPTSGQAGSQVTINGTNFSGATSVSFNGVNANIISNDGIKIVVNVPPGASTGKITVVTPGGTGTSTNNFQIPPAITSLNPTEGLPASTVVITGTNLTGTTSVKFGTANATFTVNSNTQITATVPSITAGAINISVTSPGGTSGNLTFLITDPGAKPSLLSVGGVIPNQNVIGGSVLVKGTNLVGVTSLKFGNSTLTPDSKTDVALTFIVPAGFADEAVVDISVVANTGTSNKVTFKVVNASKMGSDGVPNAPGVTIINPPPPSYVPSVQNQWLNEADINDTYNIFFGSGGNDCSTEGCLFDANPTQCINNFINDPTKNQGSGIQVNHDNNGNFSSGGTFTYDVRKIGNVCNNYVEMTIDGITYVGRYDYKNGDPACGGKRMILVSSKSGKQLILRLN